MAPSLGKQPKSYTRTDTSLHPRKKARSSLIQPATYRDPARQPHDPKRAVETDTKAQILIQTQPNTCRVDLILTEDAEINIKKGMSR